MENLAKAERDLNRENAWSHSLEALSLAQSLDDDKRIERILFLLGGLKRLEGNYDSARYYFEHAHTLAVTRDDQVAICDYLIAIGISHEKQRNLKKGLENYLAALKIAETSNAQKQIAQCYDNIGFLYSAEKNFPLALAYFTEALKIQETLEDQVAIADSYNNIGLVHMQQEHYEDARVWYFKSLKLVGQNNPKALAMIYDNLGVTYENQGALKEGRTYYQKSLLLKEELEDLAGLAFTYGKIADNYLDGKNAVDAIPFAKKSLALSKQTGSLEYMITATKILAGSHELLKDYKQAFYYHVDHKKYQDSLFHESRSRVMAEMVTKYDMQKKEQENSSLKMAATLSESVVSKQQYVIFAAGGALGVVLLLLTFLYQSYQKSKSLAGELVAQKIQAEQINIQLQEVLEEKNNVLNVMAHDLRSPMNKVLGLTHVIRTEGGVNSQQELCLDMISSVADQGRRIITDLLMINKEGSSKLKISAFSLTSFMRDVVQEHMPEARRKSIPLYLELPNFDITITTDKDCLSRILDNLVSNAIKFSNAEKSVILRADVESHDVRIAVADYGPGFSEQDKVHLFKRFTRLSAQPTGGEASSGLGLAIVKHLVNQLSGRIELDSKLGKGATFTIRIPQSRYHS